MYIAIDRLPHSVNQTSNPGIYPSCHFTLISVPYRENLRNFTGMRLAEVVANFSCLLQCVRFTAMTLCCRYRRHVAVMSCNSRCLWGRYRGHRPRCRRYCCRCCQLMLWEHASQHVVKAVRCFVTIHFKALDTKSTNGT